MNIKNVLIIGANSYIGCAVYDYLSQYPEYYRLYKLQARGLIPSVEHFKGYDVVIDVAGIAHIKESSSNKKMYYQVNRDLTIAIAKAAKTAGVGQFILISTMSVYGKLVGHITKETKPNPVTAYGDSKLQADNAVKELEKENFKVAILRPPMVYGRDCKGNYQTLRKFAIKSPVFAKYSNKRSMIFIDNLCEFIKQVIDKEMSGVFFPQNKEYINTSEMVCEIASLHHKKIIMIPVFSVFTILFPINAVKKVFGSLTYEKTDLVEKYDFKESMKLTEDYDKRNDQLQYR